MKYKELAAKLRHFDEFRDTDIDATIDALYIDATIDALYEAEWLIEDLATLVARLCSAHGKSEVISVNAMRYLKEHDLLPSPLREKTAE